MAQVASFNMQQIMTMLSTALTKEDETWMPCSFATCSSQEDAVCGSDRSQAVEWFINLNRLFGFNPEALFMSVGILDTFLDSVKVKPKYLKCVAVTCFYLGAKSTEEAECVPSTREFVRMTGCGCSVSEIHRMELCILDKLNWDLRMSTSLDFMHLYHGLMMSMCPNLLNGFPPMSPSQHLHHVTFVLQQCLLYHQLTGFAPSVLALAILSLDLEDSYPNWSSLTIILQKMAQVDDASLSNCKKLILRCFNRRASSPCKDPYAALHDWAPTKRRADKDNDDIYDGIGCLYGEEFGDMRMTCGSQIACLASSNTMMKPAYVS